MNTFHLQYVVDEHHIPQAVILPVAEWDRIVEELIEILRTAQRQLAKIAK